MVHGVDVAFGLVKVGGNRGYELGAGDLEELLEDGEGLGAAALELEELLAVLLAQGGVNGVI